MAVRREIRWGCATMALFCALLTVRAAEAEQQEGIVGLLKLSRLSGELCKEPPRLELPVYAQPRAADIVGWIRTSRHERSDDECFRVVVNFHRRSDGSIRALPVEEYEEEEPLAAIVLEARDGWVRVRLSDGTGWIEVQQHDDYLSLEQLLLRRQAHLTEAWDRMLARTPTTGSRRVPGDPRRHLIGYIEPVRATDVRAVERPDRRAPVVATCLTHECHRTLRSTGKDPAEVAVFDRRPGWLQVAVSAEDWKNDRRVWIEDAPAWRFHALASEARRRDLENELFGLRNPNVRFIRSRTVGGRLWLYVEVMSHTIYEAAEEPRAVAAGWVSAHDAVGRSVVWFYSRD